ncbi:MAG: VOC family protein [Chloroflexi bacterium]|nr:MAG: VOC family protein [Chloroflexota bacterium]
MSHITGLAEIVLWTADKEHSLGFYQALLGLELISPPSLRNAFLKAGDGAAGIPQMIVLVPMPPEILAQPRSGQLHHIAFALTPAGFDAQKAALEAAGFAPRGGKHPVLASRTMYVNDPDGNEVEFICKE